MTIELDSPGFSTTSAGVGFKTLVGIWPFAGPQSVFTLRTAAVELTGVGSVGVRQSQVSKSRQQASENLTPADTHVVCSAFAVSKQMRLVTPSMTGLLRRH